MSSKRNRFTVTAVVAAILIVGSVLAAQHFSAMASETAAAQAAPQAAPVDVADVVVRQITDWQAYSGRLEPIDRVEIRPLVSGTLTQVHFQDGSLVKKGDVLFTIDPRPFEAAVAQVQAQLAAAQAREAYTGSDLARAERLLADNAIARRDYEEKQNASREASANMQAAQAALIQAKLNLEYTRITAPVSGRISRAMVTVGNVVAAGAGSVPLTTLVSVARMYASFDVDEQSFLKFINPNRVNNDHGAPIYLGLADEDGYPRQGSISSVDNRLDVSSGTIRVRAVFDNADGLLIPGLYARIRLGGGAPHQAVLIDEKAIGTDQAKRFVLALDAANHAAYREVKLGASQDGLRVVESGLKPGDRIVVNGLQRVRPGDVVAPTVVPMAGSTPAVPEKAAQASARPGSTSEADKSGHVLRV
jgi:multidrug efflux system membrane fusion protein